MRTREEIEQELATLGETPMDSQNQKAYADLQSRLLLDIRELLQDQPRPVQVDTGAALLGLSAKFAGAALAAFIELAKRKVAESKPPETESGRETRDGPQ